MFQEEEIIFFLKNLREEIIAAFQQFEERASFKRESWIYSSGGGGEMAVLRGERFEKAAVNFSSVEGPHFPTNEESGPFFATGISLITHMQNPLAPTVHMNLRYIRTTKRFWFGGGYDLTPMGFPEAEDTLHFHSVAKKTLDPFGEDLYSQFSKNAKDYFYIPHKKRERGVGGIFFDHFNRASIEDFLLWKAVGIKFLEAILPIYQRRVSLPYSEEQKELQLKERAAYVEFNLMYDRGTKFGFLSGGYPPAILCSLPPLVRW